MNRITRRNFFKTTGAGVAGSAFLLNSSAQSAPKTKMTGYKRLKLGIASYSFRKFTLEQTIEMTKRLGVTQLALKDMHLPLTLSDTEIQLAAAKVREAGLDLYGCGVVYMRSEDEVHRAFAYAKAADMKVIIGVPEHKLLDLVNQKVKETGIIVAIHNHGPGDERYPSPQSIYDKIKNLDEKIGLCIDIGHTARIGLNPTVETKKYADRLYDVHIKDVSAPTEKGQTLEIGRGIIDIPQFLRTLLKLKYKGSVSLEYEKDADDPLAGAAESIGYVKGVLALL